MFTEDILFHDRFDPKSRGVQSDQKRVIFVKELQVMNDFYDQVFGGQFKHELKIDVLLGLDAIGKQSFDCPVDNLESALEKIRNFGGEVIAHWEYPDTVGANCKDPEGNNLIVWSRK
jgi:predicted enzyme related to lactoylglutathione lyase